MERRSFGFGWTVSSVRIGGRTDRLLPSVEDMMVDMAPKMGSRGMTGRISARERCGVVHRSRGLRFQFRIAIDGLDNRDGADCVEVVHTVDLIGDRRSSRLSRC